MAIIPLGSPIVQSSFATNSTWPVYALTHLRQGDPIIAGHKEEFAQFLRHLLVCYPGKRLLVIHDRGAQHTGTGIAEVVREAAGRLILKPQPAYSPELNPQERIWKWLRRVVTHNHWFATLREQIDAIRNFFRYLAGVKGQVRQLCGFKNPEFLVASL